MKTHLPFLEYTIILPFTREIFQNKQEIYHNSSSFLWKITDLSRNFLNILIICMRTRQRHSLRTALRVTLSLTHWVTVFVEKHYTSKEICHLWDMRRHHLINITTKQKAKTNTIREPHQRSFLDWQGRAFVIVAIFNWSLCNSICKIVFFGRIAL